MNPALGVAAVRCRPWLAELDPRVKIGWVLAHSCLAFVVSSLPALAAQAVLVLLPLAGLRLTLRGWLALAFTAGLIVWGTVLSQAIFYPPPEGSPALTVIPSFRLGPWTLDGLRLSWAGAQYGLVQSLRLAALAVAGMLLCLSTSPERLLAALAALRVPAALVFLTAAGLRFLPAVVQEWMLVRQARRLRGYRPSWKELVAPWRWLARELALFLPLLALMLRRSATLAASISSRGFDPRLLRTQESLPQLQPAQRAALVIMLVAAYALVAMKLLLWLDQAQWLHLPVPAPWQERVARWL